MTWFLNASRGSQYQFCKSTGVIQPTVQNSIEEGLKKLFNLEGERPIIVRFCSRTDSGVHALKAALFVDLPKATHRFLHPISIKQQLNAYFGTVHKIRISEVIIVPDTFNFREACLSKTYLYRLGILKEEYYLSRKKINLPISEIQRTFFAFPKKFDVKKAEEATSLFVGEKDFAAVGKKSKQGPRPTVCNIYSFVLEPAQPQIPIDYENEKFLYYHLTCKGTRFLYHMVRAMAGTVFSVGVGRVSLDDVKMLFEKPEPSSWLPKIPVLPGFGLYLIDTTLDPQKLVLETNKKCEADKSLLENVSDVNSSRAEAA